MDVRGVDALYFGLFDLCLSMGRNPMEMPFPQIEDIMERTLELGKQKGVAIGVAAGTPDELRQRLSQGYTFVNYGCDYQLLRDTALAGIEAFRTEYKH